MELQNTTAQIKKELDGRSLEDKQADFLQQFEKVISVSKACKRAKVSRSVLYHNWLLDPEFKKRYEASAKLASQAIEDEMVRRAHEGVVKPVFQGGKKVGSIREYSDTLLIVLAKAHDPERFKDRFYNEHTGKGGGPVEHRITHEVQFKNSKDPAAAPDKQEEGSPS